MMDDMSWTSSTSLPHLRSWKLREFIHFVCLNNLGACTLRGPLWVILEFCPHGDLLQFLRLKREVRPEWEKDEEKFPGVLCLMDLLRMTTDISEGMR